MTTPPPVIVVALVEALYCPRCEREITDLRELKSVARVVYAARGKQQKRELAEHTRPRADGRPCRQWLLIPEGTK